jgi:hypothetical protein
VPPEITGTVEDLTGTPARAFTQWARDHAADRTQRRTTEVTRLVSASSIQPRRRITSCGSSGGPVARRPQVVRGEPEVAVTCLHCEHHRGGLGGGWGLGPGPGRIRQGGPQQRYEQQTSHTRRRAQPSAPWAWRGPPRGGPPGSACRRPAGRSGRSGVRPPAVPLPVRPSGNTAGSAALSGRATRSARSAGGPPPGATRTTSS